MRELDSGKVLGRKEEDKRIYPASLTKIMTVVLAMEKLGNLEHTTVLESDIFPELYAEGASMAGFAPGDQVSYRDLFYGAMLPSGAECCEALARVCEGTEAAFAESMNEKAEELEMKHTHFTNATGLHNKNHYTTAEDLSLALILCTEKSGVLRNFHLKEPYHGANNLTAGRIHCVQYHGTGNGKKSDNRGGDFGR